MKVPALFFLVTALLLNAAANILMKAGAMDLSRGTPGPLWLRLATNGPLIAGVAGFGFALFFYSLALQRLDLSVCYPVMTGGGLLVVTVASALRYRETLGADKIVGIVLILIGTSIFFRRAMG